jgi:hypothetical protein
MFVGSDFLTRNKSRVALKSDARLHGGQNNCQLQKLNFRHFKIKNIDLSVSKKSPRGLSEFSLLNASFGCILIMRLEG